MKISLVRSCLWFEVPLPAPFWDLMTILQCKSNVLLPQGPYIHPPRALVERRGLAMVVGKKEDGEHRDKVLRCNWIVAEMLHFLDP